LVPLQKALSLAIFPASKQALRLVQSSFANVNIVKAILAEAWADAVVIER
jgi:hypothetical protein